MIQLPSYAGKTVAVLGLAKSGLVAARALAASGAEVWAWDDDAAKRAEAEQAGVPVTDLAGAEWTKPAALVLSPGIPHTFPKPHPVAAAARERRCPIIGDIELLLQACPGAQVVAITGTNGKSTTTALTGHVLAQAGRVVEVGGNIGRPALELTPLGPEGIYVLEMSSYQLEITPSLSAEAAVLLNITPDHLGRHGGMEGYVGAKQRIFANQSGKTAVIGVDDEHCRALYTQLVALGDRRVIPISGTHPAPGGVYGLDGELFDGMAEPVEKIIDLRTVRTLTGEHNWQNAAACYAACRALGLQRDEIAAGLDSYPGLAHRQELIAVIDGVPWINDSKATNADAAAKALACYGSIIWIAGGQPKEGGIDSLEPYFPRIRHALLIGEAMQSFAQTMSGKVPLTLSGDLDTAVTQAQALARRDRHQGVVVLLSPACASFDQFQNFEHRGERFRALVQAIAHGAQGTVPPSARRAAP
jgi:UDP-N-acetylmuramoylalanine--D-glutamate ligase